MRKFIETSLWATVIIVIVGILLFTKDKPNGPPCDEKCQKYLEYQDISHEREYR